MSWLTKISLRNRSIVALVVVAVLAAGVYAVSSLKEELIPDITVPYLTVLTVDPEAAPADIEREITAPLEQAIKTASDVKEYESYSNDSMSIITVSCEYGTDMEASEAEIQQAVSAVDLPDTAQSPEVAALNFGSMPVVQLAVSSSLPDQQLAVLLGSEVVPRLQGIDGVQAVTLSGVQQQQQLEVKLDAPKAAALGVLPTQVAKTLQEANLTTGVGTVTSGTIVCPVTVSATAGTVKEIEALALPSETSAVPVTVGDVATVRVVAAPLTAVTRTNGEPSVGISVSKSSDGNTVEIAGAVADALPRITRDLGGKAEISTVISRRATMRGARAYTGTREVAGAVTASTLTTVAVFLPLASSTAWRPSSSGRSP